MVGPKTAAWLVVAFSVIPCVQTLGQGAVVEPKDDRGLIDGIVTYQDKRPVEGATVYAEPLGRAMGAIVPHADTDETGYYAIHIPRSWFGKFAVAAKKEDEDYPDLSQQFYSDGKFQTVILSSHHPTETVIIRLGPKAGVLLGTVADAVSNAPLSPCVEFRRASEPNNFLSASGWVKPKYKLLIPADTDILVKISLDGYKAWYYPGTAEHAKEQAVRLNPGEKQVVDIRLQPDEAIKAGCPKPIGTAVNSRLVGKPSICARWLSRRIPHGRNPRYQACPCSYEQVTAWAPFLRCDYCTSFMDTKIKFSRIRRHETRFHEKLHRLLAITDNASDLCIRLVAAKCCWAADG